MLMIVYVIAYLTQVRCLSHFITLRLWVREMIFRLNFHSIALKAMLEYYAQNTRIKYGIKIQTKTGGNKENVIFALTFAANSFCTLPIYPSLFSIFFSSYKLSIAKN